MSRTWILFAIGLALYLHSSAQTNYKEGIVIGNNGDTLRGKIDYRNWRSNPKVVRFQHTNGQVTTYTPMDIRSFEVIEADESYVSASVTMDPLAEDPNKALQDINGEADQEETRFLLRLVHHPTISLLLLTKGDRNHFYYRKGTEKPVELIHHFEIDKVTDQLTEVKLYQSQLATILSPCPSSIKDLDHIRYQTEDLRKAFQIYLQCTEGVKPEVHSKKESTVIRFGLVAGLSHTQYGFKGDNTTLVDDGYTASTSAVFGGMVDFALSRDLNRMHIVNELVYKNYKTGSNFTRPYGNGYTRTSDVAFDLSYIQLNTMLRYLILPLAKVNPFINIGISNAVMISSSKNSINTTYSFGNKESGEAIPGIKKYEFTPLVAGVGMNTRHFSAELRYSYNKRGFSPEITLETNPRTWWVLLTYKF